jgi:hypothetical protein
MTLRTSLVAQIAKFSFSSLMLQHIDFVLSGCTRIISAHEAPFRALQGLGDLVYV